MKKNLAVPSAEISTYLLSTPCYDLITHLNSSARQKNKFYSCYGSFTSLVFTAIREQKNKPKSCNVATDMSANFKLWGSTEQ